MGQANTAVADRSVASQGGPGRAGLQGARGWPRLAEPEGGRGQPRLTALEGGRGRAKLAELGDNEIVQRFLDGDERAFNEIVRRYDKRLQNFVFRTIGDRERAEDLIQETFVRVYRHLRRFDQTRKFSTWIYTIAGNLAKNELRNRSRNPLVLFQSLTKSWDADYRPPEWEDPRTRPDDLYRKRFLREKVNEAVSQLPEHHRVVFVLRELQGKSYEEISEITACTLGTVKSRLNRARSNFVRIIEPMIE